MTDAAELEPLPDKRGQKTPAPAPTAEPALPFPVPKPEFIEWEYDYPRALHAWVVPEAGRVAAGKGGADPDVMLTTAQVLHSVRELWDDKLLVVRILGDSMSERLQDGWKVLVDTTSAP
jgi:hypothetical protein